MIQRVLLSLVALAAMLMCAAPAHAQLGEIAPEMGRDGAGVGLSQIPIQHAEAGLPPDVQRIYRRGIEALQARQYHEAVGLFSTVARLIPNNPNVNYALGISYIADNNIPYGRNRLEHAVREPEPPAGAYLVLGLIYVQQGERAQAMATQERLSDAIGRCSAHCSDARRAQLQSAYDEITRVLAAHPEAVPAIAR